jgi:hypothetical protein
VVISHAPRLGADLSAVPVVVSLDPAVRTAGTAERFAGLTVSLLITAGTADRVTVCSAVVRPARPPGQFDVGHEASAANGRAEELGEVVSRSWRRELAGPVQHLQVGALNARGRDERADEQPSAGPQSRPQPSGQASGLATRCRKPRRRTVSKAPGSNGNVVTPRRRADEADMVVVGGLGL